MNKHFVRLIHTSQFLCFKTSKKVNLALSETDSTLKVPAHPIGLPRNEDVMIPNLIPVPDLGWIVPFSQMMMRMMMMMMMMTIGYIPPNQQFAPKNRPGPKRKVRGELLNFRECIGYSPKSGFLLFLRWWSIWYDCLSTWIKFHPHNSWNMSLMMWPKVISPRFLLVDARLKVAPLQRFKSPATGIGREKIWQWSPFVDANLNSHGFFYKLPVIHRVVFWKKNLCTPVFHSQEMDIHMHSISKVEILWRRSLFPSVILFVYNIYWGVPKPCNSGTKMYSFSMKLTLLSTLIANCSGVWAVSTIYTCWRTILSLGMVKLAWSKP